MIIKFLSIVSLKTSDGRVEFSVNKSRKNVRLALQWKGPNTVSKIIENNKIILEP
jgi:hypothetical protein